MLVWVSSGIAKRFFRRMSSFVQNLNPITGENDWIVQNDHYDYHQEIARAAFADMLHDTERNEMYEMGLKVAIEHMHKQGKKANVLDIGTGTGLLSMMAVRHGADSIVACEAFKPMSACAKEIIKLNGFESRIKVIDKKSTELTVGQDCDMDCRANILVTEVFDTELIGEGALSTFKHAHDELLEKDCIVVPHSGTVYAQVIESPLVRNWNILKDVFDDDGKLLVKVPDSMKRCKGTISLHDLQLSEVKLHEFAQLVEPVKVLRFDFSGKTPFVFDRSTINTAKARKDGKAQAVFMWWDLNMDIDNKITLSCAPYWAHPLYKEELPWRDHWMQAVYYLPKELDVKKDSEVHLVSCHDEYSLWFNLKNDLNMSQEDYASPNCDCGVHIAYSRTRIGQMNDGTRVKKYLSVIDDYVGEDSVVLLNGHGFLSGLAAAKRAKKVYVLESNSLSKRVLRTIVAENKFSNVEFIDDVKKFSPSEKIDVVLGEPYFVSSILPWDNLLYVHSLDALGMWFSGDVKVFPGRAKVMGLPMRFKDLHKIRAPLRTCQEFEMKPFDKLIEESSGISDEEVEAQPLWEYPGQALSQPKEIAAIDIKINGRDVCESTGSFDFNDVSSCNGVAFWVDWIVDVGNSRKTTITTGPIVPCEVGVEVQWDVHSRQGVCLLGHRQLKNELKYSFKYDYKSGQIKFKVF
ncbi:PREDICTED: protein arginine N-methyltransferase 7 [Nicrophorus vespilloides]|uniref:Protein arginine N-methyltransferase n=1 Tax=Nicrophorus vespilloides TaxID=110193 RepID=A0ABM1MDU2_NICVS|nr:PREDICTED: protein arginine N-methyltransferase 7 [Nicrophorus vespilloides]